MENSDNEHKAISRCLRILGFGILATFLMMTDAVKSIAGTAAGAPEKTYTFHIASKPLSEALMDFGAVTGLTVLFTQQQPSKLTAPALSGAFTATQGLDLLLAGSGYTYRFVNPRTVTLDALPPGSAKNAVMLPTLKVQAKNEVPDEIETGGPVNGYVATHDFAAEKTNAPILEIPQSISVVTQEQMQQQDIQSINQALRYTAGVASQYDGVPTDDVYTVRGFYPALYQDGMLNETQINTEPFGLDRVEVLKGPSSVLYGQNVPGGLVDFITKRPTPYRLDYFQLQGGAYGRVQGQFDLGGPIDQGGTLLYRLTGLARSSGTQQDFTPNDRLFIAPALTWHPDDRTTFTFLSHYQRDNQTYAGFYPAQGTVESNPYGEISTSLNISGPSGKYLTEDYAVGYLLEHRFDDLFTMRQNFRYQGSYATQDFLYPSGFETNPVTQKPILSTVTTASQAFHESETSITLDTQAIAEFLTGPLRHTFIFGVDYWRITADEQFGFGNGPSLNMFNPVYAPVAFPTYFYFVDQVQDDVGIYAQDQIKWRHFILLVSGRQDWAYNGTATAAFGVPKIHQGQNDSDLTGRAALLYHFDVGVAPYVSWSTSFQPNVGTDSVGNPFKPTTGEQEELGIKYQPPEVNTLLTLSLFNITQQNVLTPDPANPTFSVATGKVRSRGVELQDVTSLPFGLNLIAAYSYLDLTNVKTNDPTEGNTPYGQPKHAGSIWIFETLQHGPLAGLGFGGGIRYTGSTWDYTNTLEVPNVTLVDAALSYQWEKLKLSINATNIFDKKYVSNCGDVTSCWYGSRANVIGGASYSF